MQNKYFNKLMQENKGVFEQFHDLYWEGPDAILEAVKKQHINPDEAVIIGIIIGVKAYKIAEKKAKTEKYAKATKIKQEFIYTPINSKNIGRFP